MNPSPGLSQNTYPIFEAPLFDQRLAETTSTHNLHQSLQSGSISYPSWKFGAVQIGAKAYPVLADPFENVLEVIDHQFNGRVCIPATVGAQEVRSKVDADDATGFTDSGQLLIGKISGMRAQSMRVGMRGDEGRFADSGNVPEAAFVKMRQIDQNFQSVAGADQLPTEFRQTGPRVGRRGTAERHAMPEHIRPAPNGAKRAKSGLIQHVEDLEILIDCFRALDVKDRCQHAFLQAFSDIIDIAADENAAPRLPLDTEKKRHHAEDNPLRLRQFNGMRRQGIAIAILRQSVAIATNCPIS